MFPGSGRNHYAAPQGPPPGQYQYGPPSGAPGGGPPPGPPPQSYYAPPQGPPQGYGNQGYNRPQAPPGQAFAPPTQHERRNYSQEQFERPAHLPPQQPQSFGGNSGITYQYSQCSGRKKALLVGINYFGSKNELRGCINDVKNMSQFLVQRWGYKWEDMVILTDDLNDRARVPTKENIIRAMQWLVKDARPNDSLVFHFSGHGGVTEDLNGDEESGFDDVIYPVDFEVAGEIVDDDMHDIMVRPLPPGCKLTALYDSCHSGTALDLPYVYSTKGVVKEPNMLKEAGSGALSAFMAYNSGNIGGAISSLTSMAKKFAKSGNVNSDSIKQFKGSPADVVSISGCKDDQTSADALENGMATGAMSWSFISTMTQQPNQLYLSLLNNMRALLSAKYSQKPQLSASHPMDMSIQFIM